MIPIEHSLAVFLRDGYYQQLIAAVLFCHISEGLTAVGAYLPVDIRTERYALLETDAEYCCLSLLGRLIARISHKFRWVDHAYAARLGQYCAKLVGYDAPIEPPVLLIRRQTAESIARRSGICDIRIVSSAVGAQLPLIAEIFSRCRYFKCGRNEDVDRSIAGILLLKLTPCDILRMPGNDWQRGIYADAHGPPRGAQNGIILQLCQYDDLNLPSVHGIGYYRLIDAAGLALNVCPFAAVQACLPLIAYSDSLRGRGACHLKACLCARGESVRRRKLILLHKERGFIGLGYGFRRQRLRKIAVEIRHLSPIDISILLACRLRDGIAVVDAALSAVAFAHHPEGLPAVGALIPFHRGHIDVLQIRGDVLAIKGIQTNAAPLPHCHDLVAAHTEMGLFRESIRAEPQIQGCLIVTALIADRAVGLRRIMCVQQQRAVAPVQPEIEQLFAIRPRMEIRCSQTVMGEVVVAGNELHLQRLAEFVLRVRLIGVLMYCFSVFVHGVSIVRHIDVAAVYHHFHGLLHIAGNGAAVKYHGAVAPDIQPLNGQIVGGYLQRSAFQSDGLGEHLRAAHFQLQRCSLLYHHLGDFKILTFYMTSFIYSRVHRVGPRLRRQHQLRLIFDNVFQLQSSV